jgi:hypothetical protein
MGVVSLRRCRTKGWKWEMNKSIARLFLPLAIILAACATVPNTTAKVIHKDVRPTALRAETKPFTPSKVSASAVIVKVSGPSINGSFLERRRLQEAMAAWLESLAFDVVPLDEVNLVAERALAGQRVSTGESCGMSAPAGTALEAAYPNTLAAQIYVKNKAATGDSPVLVVEIAGESGTTQLYEAELPTYDTTVDQIIAALPKLAPIPVPPRGQVIATIGAEAVEPAGVSVNLTAFRGPWRDRPAASIFEADGRSLDHCFHDGSGWNGVRLEVDVDGKVTSCEPSDPWSSDPGAQDCLCKTLLTTPFDAGAKGRSVLLYARHLPERVQAANGRYVRSSVREAHAGDPTVLWSPPQVPLGAVNACFEGLTVSESKVSVRWLLNTNGWAEGVQTAWPEDRLSITARSCIETALRRARFTCPQAGAPTTVDAELQVGTTRK